MQSHRQLNFQFVLIKLEHVKFSRGKNVVLTGTTFGFASFECKSFGQSGARTLITCWPECVSRLSHAIIWGALRFRWQRALHSVCSTITLQFHPRTKAVRHNLIVQLLSAKTNSSCPVKIPMGWVLREFVEWCYILRRYWFAEKK